VINNGQPAAAPAPGQVLTVNVGEIRTLEWQGETVTTGIWKSPVAGRVAVRGVNLAGDDQADREVHGGPDKAVYVYAREDTDWWETELGRPLPPGNFGENLTLLGVAVTNAVLGEQWAIGSARFEVVQPRIPCWKLGLRMNDPAFPPRFAAAGRPGAYLRILQAGEVAAGDPVLVVYRPAHGITVGDVEAVYHRRDPRLARLLDAPELPEGWRSWVQRRLARRK
jgi:MOSC domain-containing protein YiiM